MSLRAAWLGVMLLFGSASVSTAAAPDLPASPAMADAQTNTVVMGVFKQWFEGEWRGYRARFVTPEGRVVDNANGNVSHSEGQGYGLLLAVAAGDLASFELIWRWTDAHLHKRHDALFAWRWNPAQADTPDLNNASDGDVLIAWALVKAAKTFARPDFEVRAKEIVDALAAKVIQRHGEDVLLLPAAEGFGKHEQPDGPVVNLSYWIFAAFQDLAPLAPHVDWEGLRRTGLRLLADCRFGSRNLPADWTALGGPAPAPAAHFPARFGYDAVRIPLYLAQDPTVPRAVLAPFVESERGLAGDAGPTVVDLATGVKGEPMAGAGYRLVYALARCLVNGTAIPSELLSTRDQFYYPETLRLLGLSALQERSSPCL